MKSTVIIMVISSSKMLIEKMFWNAVVDVIVVVCIVQRLDRFCGSLLLGSMVVILLPIYTGTLSLGSCFINCSQNVMFVFSPMTIDVMTPFLMIIICGTYPGNPVVLSHLKKHS